MTANEILTRLRESRADLQARGVRHAALFGSAARGEARSDSDVDILVELDPSARVTVFDYVGIKEFIAGLFPQSVDVVDRDALKPHLRQTAARDAVYAF